MISRYIKWKVLAPFAMTAVIGALVVGGTVTAVTITQTNQLVEGARATTSDITDVTVTHEGITVATTAEAAAADTTITPNATDATTVQRAQVVAAGDFVYRIRFTEAVNTAGFLASTVSLRWTINSVEQTATLTVNALASGGSDTGGFELLIPGDGTDTPDAIQLIWAN